MSFFFIFLVNSFLKLIIIIDETVEISEIQLRTAVIPHNILLTLLVCLWLILLLTSSSKYKRLTTFNDF
jgi:hypothetical protein